MRVMFHCAVLLLSLALAGAPTVADCCALACETAHSHGAASSAHAGHHHRSPTSLSTIEQTPQPCGHDHSGTVGIAAPDNTAPIRALAQATVAVMPALLSPSSALIPSRNITGSNSPPGAIPRGFTSPLRV
jgi:hypothetical protein